MTDPTPKKRLAVTPLKAMKPHAYEFCIVDEDGNITHDWKSTSRNMLRHHFTEKLIRILADSGPEAWMEARCDGIRRRFRRRAP